MSKSEISVRNGTLVASHSVLWYCGPHSWGTSAISSLIYFKNSKQGNFLNNKTLCRGFKVCHTLHPQCTYTF